MMNIFFNKAKKEKKLYTNDCITSVLFHAAGSLGKWSEKLNL